MQNKEAHETIGQVACIYCQGPGPFSDEHVFCAGLGGDDPTFMLRDLVCAECNTCVFSGMEARFMRGSIEGFARVCLQPRGRNRRKRSRAPLFRAESIRVVLPNGAKAEAEVRGGGQVVILPQFFFDDGFLQAECSSAAVLREFVKVLGRIFASDLLSLVTKSQTVKAPDYLTANFHWDGTRYIHTETISMPSPPIACVWREALQRDDPDEKSPRIYRRGEGQVVFRPHMGMLDPEFLTILRRNLPALVAAAANAGAGAPLPSAPVAVSMKQTIGLRERVLAKIGVNLAAYAYGGTYIRHECFAQIKSSVLHATPDVVCTDHAVDQLGAEDFLRKVFAAIPPDRHVGILTTFGGPGGTIDLMFCVRLYGGMLTTIRLAQDVPVPPDQPQFLLVDYREHRIELLGCSDFVMQHLFPNLGLKLDLPTTPAGLPPNA